MTATPIKQGKLGTETQEKLSKNTGRIWLPTAHRERSKTHDSSMTSSRDKDILHLGVVFLIFGNSKKPCYFSFLHITLLHKLYQVHRKGV